MSIGPCKRRPSRRRASRRCDSARSGRSLCMTLTFANSASRWRRGVKRATTVASQGEHGEDGYVADSINTRTIRPWCSVPASRIGTRQQPRKRPRRCSPYTGLKAPAVFTARPSIPVAMSIELTEQSNKRGFRKRNIATQGNTGDRNNIALPRGHTGPRHRCR